MANYLDDVLIFGGLLALFVGLWLVDPAIAWIVVGALLYATGMMIAWSRRGGG